MRIDVVTIFPEYLTPLELSLAGKARDGGLIDVHVHDLRQWTHDRHNTVDDSPYGGGAGMVMKPEPWGEALDAVAPDDVVLVVPTPSGLSFSQRVAEELAGEPRLVFACGRYEGIDERVIDEASSRMRVRELSIGDYVLGGGEVAALAVIEAVVRLLPGFMGNPDSLVEESHGTSRLLEYPVYTKPASWRGRQVPDVLLSGNHAAIQEWRHDQAVRRTAQRRPDLAHPARFLGAGDAIIRPAHFSDAGEILTLQRACWAQEAIANNALGLPALHESLDDVRADLDRWTTFVVRASGRLVGAVRGRLEGEVWEIGRVMVAPDLQGRGLGRLLLEHIQQVAPEAATSFSLNTGAKSHDNLRRYKRAGFRLVGELPLVPGVVVLSKERRPSTG